MSNANPKNRSAKKDYTWMGYIHPDDRDRVRKSVIKTLQSDKSEFWESEYRYALKKDQFITVQDKGYIVYDQNQKAIRMLGAMRDITLRKANENKLKQMSVNLEEKNKKLIEFAYLLSHNTRAPLANILGIIELLQTLHSMERQEEHEIQELIPALSASADKLDQVIKVLNKMCDIRINYNQEELSELFELTTNFNMETVIKRFQEHMEYSNHKSG